MKVLFVGNFWLGSNARSMKDAFARIDGLVVDEIDIDGFLPSGSSRLILRAAYRLLRPTQARELADRVRDRASAWKPDVIIVYKGLGLTAELIEELRRNAAPVMCIFPDKSTRQFGPILAAAMGAYDLVFSAKKFHPAIWSEDGYRNRCVHVGHGYDPVVHYRAAPATEQTHDVVMVATWRPEYDELVRSLLQEFGGGGLTVAIGGTGWDARRFDRPAGWSWIGGQHGHAYTEWLRRGRIVLAPIETRLTIDGRPVPGDQVTARTFECAGAYTFFIHTRTDEALETYDETTEVPMYSDASDLARKVRHYLDRPEERRVLAAAAHARAVPAYSYDSRAAEIMQHVRAHLRSLTCQRSAQAT